MSDILAMSSVTKSYVKNFDSGYKQIVHGFNVLKYLI